MQPRSTSHQHPSIKLPLYFVPLKLILIGWILAFGVLGCDSSNRASQHGLTTTQTAVSATGTPAPWSVLFSTAKQAALQIDPSALVTRIAAEPEGPLTYEGSYESLKIDFNFLRPAGPTATLEDRDLGATLAGQEMKVSLIDTAPSYTLKIDPHYDLLGPFPLHELEKENKQVSQLTISPAQALKKTIGSGRAYSQRQAAKVWPSILLLTGRDIPTGITSDAAWAITYFTKAGMLNFLIDARTGEILSQTEFCEACPPSTSTP